MKPKYTKKGCSSNLPEDRRKKKKKKMVVKEVKSKSTENVMYLKVLVDKKQNRVVFAESDREFVDVLFSFLTLPMGTIVRLIRDQSEPSVLGCMNSFYQGMESLKAHHFMYEAKKEMLLRPSNSSEHLCRKLKLNIDDTKPTIYLTCDCCRDTGNVLLGTDWFHFCRKSKILNSQMYLNKEYCNNDLDKGIFVKETATFMITDDLEVMPMSTSVCVELLEKIGATAFNMLEEMTVKVGLGEVLSLLRLLFVSETPLTDLFLATHTTSKAASLSKADLWAPYKQIQSYPVGNCKKMTLKLILSKSENKVLYAEACGDFVDYLLSQLIIPLGTIVKLLYQRPPLRCVHNLYKSVEKLEVGLYLKSEHLKKKLLSPQIAAQFWYQIHPLGIEENFYPQSPCEFESLDSKTTFRNIRFTMVKSVLTGYGKNGFVKDGTKFMVTDDLTVLPLSPISGISIFNKLNVPVSDIEERVVEFGKEEALNLLEAALISNSALTNAFNFHRSVRKPKIEKTTGL